MVGLYRAARAAAAAALLKSHHYSIAADSFNEPIVWLHSIAEGALVLMKGVFFFQLLKCLVGGEIMMNE
jgi:hypothetical protein